MKPQTTPITMTGEISDTPWKSDDTLGKEGGVSRDFCGCHLTVRWRKNTDPYFDDFGHWAYDWEAFHSDRKIGDLWANGTEHIFGAGEREAEAAAKELARDGEMRGKQLDNSVKV